MVHFFRRFSATSIIERLQPHAKSRRIRSACRDVEKDQVKPLMAENVDGRDEPKSQTVILSKLSNYWPPCAVLAVVFVLVLALGVVVVDVSEARRQTSKEATFGAQIMVKPCGETPDEARERRCHFDIISFCWLPDECYDAELSQDFDDANQLEWFLDPNRTQPVSHEQIMTGEYTGLYVNWEYHLRHCTAMWKKMHRAIFSDLGRGAIDGYIGSYEHTKHCGHMLLGDHSIAWDAINTRIAVKYPDCGV